MRGPRISDEDVIAVALLVLGRAKAPRLQVEHVRYLPLARGARRGCRARSPAPRQYADPVCLATVEKRWEIRMVVAMPGLARIRSKISASPRLELRRGLVEEDESRPIRPRTAPARGYALPLPPESSGRRGSRARAPYPSSRDVPLPRPPGGQDHGIRRSRGATLSRNGSSKRRNPEHRCKP